MTDNKPVGGRGKKANYDTKVIRVPLPVVDEVESLIADFRNGNEEQISDKKQDTLTLDEALEAARKVLKSKKSASVSVKKLLQVLYGCEINL